MFRINSSPLFKYEKHVGTKATYDIVNPFHVSRAPHADYIVDDKAGQRQKPLRFISKFAVKPNTPKCPQFFLRHELFIWEPKYNITVTTESDFTELVERQTQPFSLEPIAHHHYTRLTDVNVTGWMLRSDRRLKTKQYVNIAGAVAKWTQKLPNICPKPRVLHPAFDVFTKQFAGLPGARDYSTGIWTILLAATMCKSVNLYGFGGPTVCPSIVIFYTLVYPHDYLHVYT